MNNSYTVYWSRERVDALKRLPDGVGMSKVLFGGPHQSQPSFSKAGVRAGDLVFPINIANGRLNIIGAVSVDEIVDAQDVVALQFRPYLPNDNSRWIVQSGWPEELFYSILCVTCVDEALVAKIAQGPFKALCLNDEETENLTYQNRRSLRAPKGVEDGRIKSSLSFRGVYRLSPMSAEMFSKAVQKENSRLAQARSR